MRYRAIEKYGSGPSLPTRHFPTARVALFIVIAAMALGALCAA